MIHDSRQQTLFVEQRRDVRIVGNRQVGNVSRHQSPQAFIFIQPLLLQLDELSKTLDGFKGGNGLI